MLETEDVLDGEGTHKVPDVALLALQFTGRRK